MAQIYEWKTGLVSRVDTHKARDGKQTAVIWPPKELDAASAADIKKLPDFLRSKGYDVSFEEVKKADKHFLNVPVASQSDAAALAAELLKKGYRTSFEGAAGKTLQISGFKSSDDIQNVWRDIHSKGLEASHEVKVGPTVSALRVNGYGKDKNLLNSLSEAGYTNGQPIDPYEGKSPLRKAWSTVQGKALQYAGFIYVAGDSFNTYSGIKRGLVGETLMGLGFMSGSAMLIKGKTQPRTPEQLLENAIKDFKISNSKDGEVFDFSRNSEFTTAKIKGGTFVNSVNDFVDSSGPEGMALMNFGPGLISLAGGLKEKKKFIKHDANYDVVLESGRAVMGEKYDIPQIISGALLGSMWFPATFLPQKSAGRDILIDPAEIASASPLSGVTKFMGGFADTTVGKTLLYVPNKVINALHERPRFFAGYASMLHNIQQLFFSAVVERRETLRDIEGYKNRFAELFKQEFTDNGKPIPAAESEYHRKYGVSGYKEMIQLFKDFSDVKEVQRVRLEHEDFHQRVFVEEWTRLHDTNPNMSPMELRDRARRVTNAQELPVIDVPLYEETRAALPFYHKALKEGILSLDDKDTYRQVIKEYESRINEPDDKIYGSEKKLYALALARSEYERLNENKNLFMTRVRTNMTFLMANFLFSHADAGHSAGKTNAAQAGFNFPALYDKAANLLTENGHAEDNVAIGNLAKQLAAQPEMKALEVVTPQIEAGIRARLAGEMSLEEKHALQNSVWGDNPSKSNGASVNDDSAYSRGHGSLVDLAAQKQGPDIRQGSSSLSTIAALNQAGIGANHA